ncbi:hypothetical protein RhiirA4_415540 [Rhizophagus irregularis]|uniref:MIR domain-containing protein n=1 Tax=Rhizophagus irregularis TaxID=588596 RepID=A0A2I1G0C0_9GLOM|nr:hypothetical protein RhiirA4_415540 [Rhizophagus irregularis]
MEPPIYDGRIHPNEYIKKMRTYCNFRQIKNEKEILKFAIMNIDSTIDIPKNITSFDVLVNVLKEHISFNIFKNSCKRKLENSTKSDVIGTSIGTSIGTIIGAIFSALLDFHMVYCDDFGPNALWSISSSTKSINSAINYGKPIQLRHEILSEFFYTDMNEKSPTSNHFRVYCDEKERKNHWIIGNYHHQNNDDNVKSQDIITLQWKQSDVNKNILLRSHEFEDYQEVFAHDQRTGGNDQWCIELIGYRDT